MKKLNTTFVLLVVLTGAIFLGVGCSDEDNSRDTTLAKDVMDTITNTVAENLAEGFIVEDAELANKDQEVPEHQRQDGAIEDISDFVFAKDELYATFNGGVIKYCFSDNTQNIIPFDEKFNAIGLHDGQIYVGGDYLYELVDEKLVLVDQPFDGRVTDLYSYNNQLMVGTDFGLYVWEYNGPRKVFDDTYVTSMVADNDGLWVGTEGDGLYRWDGENFKKRYLIRDSSLFDYVNSLAFNHDHLYVGSSKGLHIFDGGKWTNLSEADGLVADNINHIDASGWVVYLASDKGVMSYFNDELKPVIKLENQQATVVGKNDSKLVVATTYDGLLMKKGGALSTIVQPLTGTEVDILSLVY